MNTENYNLGLISVVAIIICVLFYFVIGIFVSAITGDNYCEDKGFDGFRGNNDLYKVENYICFNYSGFNNQTGIYDKTYYEFKGVDYYTDPIVCDSTFAGVC